MCCGTSSSSASSSDKFCSESTVANPAESSAKDTECISEALSPNDKPMRVMKRSTFGLECPMMREALLPTALLVALACGALILLSTLASLLSLGAGASIKRSDCRVSSSFSRQAEPHAHTVDRQPQPLLGPPAGATGEAVVATLGENVGVWQGVAVPDAALRMTQGPLDSCLTSPGDCART